MSEVLKFCVDNQSLILGLLLAISEALGANPKVKSNGFLSSLLILLKSLNQRSSNK